MFFLTQNNKLTIVELSFEPYISEMHDYTIKKCTPLVHDIKDKGITVFLHVLAMEIGESVYVTMLI